jgi:nitroimidazol reductase NimA-like FMN-containing flavoprotein (pyridoxamine 5'-phosphate oxidase superfamily)
VVAEPAEKVEALRCIVDHVRAGRSDEARPPTEKELAATLVLSLPLTEWSVKVRSGGPLEDPDDAALPWFSGVVPVGDRRAV